MAARRTIVIFGDTNAAGLNPVAELAAIDPSYDDVQTEMLIWNPQASPPGTWQQLQPGINSNPAGTLGNDLWSFESRMRDAIRPWYTSGTFYVVKHAEDSTLHFTDAKPSWDPIVASSAFITLKTTLTDAAAAAHLAGDTLEIVGILGCLFTDDFQLAYGWRSYGDAMRTLIEAIRTLATTVPYCTSGTLRSDGGPIPVVLVEPHYEWSGLSLPELSVLEDIRLQLRQLHDDTGRIKVFRTHQSLCIDNVHFDPLSTSEGTEEIGALFFPELAKDDAANPEAPLVLILGDSIHEGFGSISDNLPAHLRDSALAGVKIWQPRTGDFGTLQNGVNNLISAENAFVPGIYYSFHGPEIPLGELLRSDLGTLWMVKATIIGTFASVYRKSLENASGPLHNPAVSTWHPVAKGQIFDLMVLGWVISAIDSLRRQNRKPKPKLVCICLGTNDALFAGTYPSDAGSAIRTLVGLIKQTFTDLNVDISDLKFTIAVPKSTFAGVFAATEESMAAVREGILALQATQPDIQLVDLNPFASDDNIHLSSDGMDAYSDAIYAAWKGAQTAQIQPMFMPSNLALRKALRLSGVPDTNDGSAVIDTAVETVKVGFFRALGEAKILQIRAIPYNIDPRTSAEYLRTLAATTEVKWVRSQLLRTMPLLFMDGTARVQAWQEEAAFRDGSFLQTRDELRRLDDEIQVALEVLRTSDLSQGYSSKMTTVAPDDSIRPGDTVFGVI